MYLYGHALKELKQMLVSLEASHVTLSRMEFALRPRLGLKQLLLILLLSASKKKKISQPKNVISRSNKLWPWNNGVVGLSLKAKSAGQSLIYNTLSDTTCKNVVLI